MALLFRPSRTGGHSLLFQWADHMEFMRRNDGDVRGMEQQHLSTHESQLVRDNANQNETDTLALYDDTSSDQAENFS